MAELSAKREYERRDYVGKLALVARVCRRMEGGETLPQVCRDPTMPPYSTVTYWLKRYPELGDQVCAVREAYPDLHRRRTHHRWDERLATEFLGRIVDGRGLAEVCAAPDMPGHASVERWLAERPGFAARYARAREAQADRLFDLAWRIACDVGEAPAAGAVAAARLKINTLKWRVGRLAPRKYGSWRMVEAAEAAAAAEAAGEYPGGAVQFEARRFAVTPQRQVVDITRHVRGMSGQEIEAFSARVKAGWMPPDLGPLAPDEHIASAMLVRRVRG